MTATTVPPLDLDRLVLTTGSHASPSQGACLLEASSWLAGGPWTDHPECVSSILAGFGRNLNDVLPDDKRQRLVPFVPRLLSTAGDGLDERRGYLALDWLVRSYLPGWLRLVPGLVARADELASAGRIVDLASVAALGGVVRVAAREADAAWARAAAGAWAGAAAGAAARDAAGAAARDAAGAAFAAGVAAAAAAGAAAGAAFAAGVAAAAAAGAAARSLPAPTVDALQDSAISLFDRMIDGAA